MSIGYLVSAEPGPGYGPATRPGAQWVLDGGWIRRGGARVVRLSERTRQEGRGPAVVEALNRLYGGSGIVAPGRSDPGAGPGLGR